MSLPMVKEAGVPDREDMRLGMAFFANTGPAGKTCGDCKCLGYMRESTRGHWSDARQQVEYKSYRVKKCSLFKKMAGHHGSVVDLKNPACKYFDQKPR